MMTARRKRLMLFIAVAVAAAGLAGGLTATLYPRGGGATSAPPSAVRAATGLTSRNLATVRQALAAGDTISQSELAPAGTSMRVVPGTWEEKGGYGTVRAVMSMPGHAPLTVTIYFKNEAGQWRVLFADPS